MTVSSEFVRHTVERAMREGSVEEDGLTYSITLKTEEDAQLMADTMPAVFEKEVNLEVQAEVSEVLPTVVTFKFPRDLPSRLLGL